MSEGNGDPRSADERIQAAVQAGEDERKEADRLAKLPICPYCEESPATFATVSATIPVGNPTTPTIPGIVIFCGNPKCRKIYSIHPVPMRPAQQRVQGVKTGFPINLKKM